MVLLRGSCYREDSDCLSSDLLIGVLFFEVQSVLAFGAVVYLANMSRRGDISISEGESSFLSTILR
jgi:hypothetical protein